MTEEQPLACDLTAIEDEHLEIHKSNGEEVFKSVQSWKELSNGFALKLPTETDIIEKAGAFISRERLCCPFFDFALEVAPNQGPVWLKITNNQQRQIKEFIEVNIISQLDSAN